MKAVLKQIKRSGSGQVEEQLKSCTFAASAHKNRILLFCEKEGITDILQLDYTWRLEYERYLAGTNVAKQDRYLYAFDRIATYYRKKACIHLSKTDAFSYQEKVIFLLYDVREDKIDYLFKMREKEHLVWDFTLPCPVQLKKQIAKVLNHLIEEMDEEHDLRLYRRYLITLKKLYEFCYEYKIDDLFTFDKYEENRFFIFMNEKLGYFKTYAKPVINLCRKVLFLQSKEINWDAAVWYMQRFSLDEARVNESDRIETFSFMSIENKENMKELQEYVKYLIGLTDLSLSTIRTIKYRLEEFIIYIGSKSIYQISAYDIDAYIERQLALGNRKEFIDRKLVILDKWYRNLLSYERIDKLPFHLEYYVTSSFENTHHDRTVEERIIDLILENLWQCDETLRLIFLIQLCTARRISEVCQIKAGSLKVVSDDFWICFYQPKMHADIMVPIPEELYKLLKGYIDIQKRRNDEYLFQDENGKAYRSGTYQKKMISFCKSCGIEVAGYEFKSHDFRHTLATQLYNQGASVQVIRDFLGHKSDEMTKQYIDFIPRQIEEKSRSLFKEKQKMVKNHDRSVIS